MRIKSILSKLEKEVSPQVEVRRYNLPNMISESYRTLYNCESGTNLHKLVESHLEDVRQNPSDIERLSRQLAVIKEVQKLTESGEIKDKDLEAATDSEYEGDVEKKVAEEREERQAPTEEIKESKEEDLLGNDATLLNTVEDYLTAEEFEGIKKYVGSDCSIIKIDRGRCDIKFSDGKVIRSIPLEYLEVQDYNESKEEDLLEDTELTDEEVEELTKHLAEIRKNKQKVAESEKPEFYQPTKEEAAAVVSRIKRKFGTEISEQDYIELISAVIGEGNISTDIIDTEAEKAGIKILGENAGVELEEAGIQDSEVLKYEQFYHRWKSEFLGLLQLVWPGEILSSVRRQMIEKINDIDNAALKKLGKEILADIDSFSSIAEPTTSESKTYESLNLSEFRKKSAGKAFVKTFKKLDKQLHEGTALTRQDAISLYKAANSAMTHLSVELEHNPEFLHTFTESTTLLSKDVTQLLESMMNGKAPNASTMKSLAKFSEAMLREADEEEELPPVEDEEDNLTDEEITPETEKEETPAADMSEEVEEFDREYADARIELHKEMTEEHADDENPEIAEKLTQDAEEILELPGITKEQTAEIESELEGETPAEDVDEAAFSGGMAGDNSIGGGTGPRSNYSPQRNRISNTYLGKLMDKNDGKVEIITIKAKDFKPGMIMQAGQIQKVESRYEYGKKKIYIVCTNGYWGSYDLEADMEVMADFEDKSKPSTRRYSELKSMGLKESDTEDELPESAYNGGQAEGGFRDTYKRPGGSTSGSGSNHRALDGRRTKKVLAKDIKPGMVTNTGKVLRVTDRGDQMEIGYGYIGNRGSYASDNVSKNFEYDVLDENLDDPEETKKDIPDLDLGSDPSEITDDELAELRKHLREMRLAAKSAIGPKGRKLKRRAE